MFSSEEILNKITISSHGLGAEITTSTASAKSAKWILTLDNGQVFEIKVTDKTKGI